MELSLFDLHCDTAYAMHRSAQGLLSNNLAISLQNAAEFNQFVQIMAIWTDHSLSDEDGWNAYQSILSYLKNDPAILSKKAYLTTLYEEPSTQTPHLMLAVEDARILAGDADRLIRLWRDGIRILTPLWKGNSCIGGAHDTGNGLTPFGRQILQKAVSLGMIPDISHASEQSAEEIFEIASHAQAPVIASHSNAYEICPASRNLRRAQADQIRRSDGVVGLNLYPYFLRLDGNAGIRDVLAHVDYFLSIGLCDQLCLGCDMDGADMPPEIQTLADLPRLAELLLSENYSEALVRNLFFGNANRFANKHLKLKQ